MKRTSLDKVLYCAKTHRCIHSGQIRKGVDELMSRHIWEFIYVDINDSTDEEWIKEMITLTTTGDRNAIYADVVKTMNDVPFRKFRAIKFLILASIGIISRSADLYWLRLSAEDVMREAGLEKYWENYFTQDAMLWEQQRGYAPSIGNILGCCFHLYKGDNDEKIVCPAMASLFDLKSAPPQKPFFRKRTEYVFNYPWDAKEMSEDVRNANLVALWVWYLMVVAPALLWGKENISVTLYDRKLMPVTYRDEEFEEFVFRKEAEALYRRNSM